MTTRGLVRRTGAPVSVRVGLGLGCEPARDADSSHGTGQRVDDITEPAGLGPGLALGGDADNPHVVLLMRSRRRLE